MAENLENLSGAERIAALKAKMQASAKARAEEASDEPEPEATAATAPAAAAEPAAKAASETETAPVAEAVVTEAGDAAESVATDAVEEAASAADAVADDTATETDEDSNEDASSESGAVESTNGVASNGASAGGPMAPPPVLQGLPEEDPEAALQREYSRREFLTYAWGAATALVLAETGLGMYVFMYPRFRAGEFGGKFFVDAGTWPVNADAPQGNPDGKFWMVETEDGGKKAIYMVCTHLGCLYKWEPANWRFECPCHGSKFTHDGFYIEGPAPRSLDSFALAEENGEVVVDTGAKVTGDPASESPARRLIG